jgi:CRISPR/Cas system CSM-associated protein Csm3 (group 7 of RAMP superfamily)
VARNIHSRLRLTGLLVTRSPLHVGGYGDDIDTDMPLARDGAGRLYVPGTSVAGALREHAVRLFGDEVVNRLWGNQHDAGGHASFVMIDDVDIKDSAQIVVEVRDGVGIDRRWGAAAEHIKYDRAILPRGTQMTLNLTVDVEQFDKLAEAVSVVAALKESLENGRIRLGASKTRGLGRIYLKQGTITQQIFCTRLGILDRLRNPSGVPVEESSVIQARASSQIRSCPRLTITIKWKPVGPLMVKAGFDGIAADVLPLTSGIDGQIAMVLPGSSIKGVLRSQAERIVRTLLNRKVSGNFLDDVQLDLIDELFGKRGQEVGTKANSDWLPGLGSLSVSDCFGQHRMTQQQWESIQAATNDRQLRQLLNVTGLRPWAQSYHVAIDRWLGSAAEKMLYSVLEPHSSEWESMTLELDFNRLPEKLQIPGVVLILLLLRDLAQSRLPLGFGTHRGMGAVQVDGVHLRGEDLPQELVALRCVELDKGQLSSLPSSFRETLNRAWTAWIDQHISELTV